MPDERQHARFRLKLAVLEVRTGQWSVFSPLPFEDTAWSTGLRRAVADQKQVESLKRKAYEAGVRDFVRTYGDLAATQ